MAGRPLIIPWQEDEEELYELYRTEKNARRRSRLQALWLLRQGRSIREVSDLIDLPYATLQRWIRWYRAGGTEEVLRRLPGHNAPGHPTRLTEAQLEALTDRANAGGFHTVWDAVHWIQEEFGIEYSYPGMHALFQRHKIRKRSADPNSDRAWQTSLVR